MKRSKILVGLVITVAVVFVCGIGVSYYLMSRYPILGNVFDSDPIAVLEAASKVAFHHVASSPTKRFNVEDADRDYDKSIAFPENRLELETAEQIIEWSVTHQRQPWVENIPDFLQESSVPINDITLHLVFIHTKSGAVPVMTVTYQSLSNIQIVEKGWVERMTPNAYTGLVTEDFAVALLKSTGDDKFIVKTIIQNYDGAITLIKE